MSVQLDQGVIVLDGNCLVEEAETLFELVEANPGAPVDWSGCQYLHTAVAQVIMALRPHVIGEPADPFLSRWVGPALKGEMR